MKKIRTGCCIACRSVRPAFAEEAKTVGNAPAEAKFSTVSKDEMFSSKLKGLNVTNQKDETSARSPISRSRTIRSTR